VRRSAEDPGEGEWVRDRGAWTDSPMRWSIPLGRLAGVEIRLHLLWPFLAAIEMTRAWLGHSALGPAPTAAALGCLLASVLLHELGHVAACRRLGGTADEILLWPLGGLAACRPPHDWWSNLVVAMAGPLVNLALLLAAGLLLLAAGAPAWGAAFPHPLEPAAALALVGGGGWKGVVVLLGWVNLILLLLNLVPLMPLDGGRVVQAIAWRRQGELDATMLAIRVGQVAAIVLGLVGLLIDQLGLVAIAVIGWLWGWQVSRAIRLGEGASLRGDGLPAGAFEPSSEWTAPRANDRAASRAEEKAAREREALAREQVELDRVLEKIQREGLDSLSIAERRVLRRATTRRRRDEA